MTLGGFVCGASEMHVTCFGLRDSSGELNLLNVKDVRHLLCFDNAA